MIAGTVVLDSGGTKWLAIGEGGMFHPSQGDTVREARDITYVFGGSSTLEIHGRVKLDATVL
jgi:hypothetical protein